MNANLTSRLLRTLWLFLAIAHMQPSSALSKWPTAQWCFAAVLCWWAIGEKEGEK